MDDFEPDVLSSLRDCLSQIYQAKITEKKKQVEKLKVLLKRNEVLKALDNNSSKKCRKDSSNCQSFMTWSKVFNVVQGYIKLEADRLREKESGMDTPSQIVLTNRMKDKKYCTDLFKYIVKVINSRSHHGTGSTIVGHLMAILANSLNRTAFGFDYTNVLLKEILPSPTMCVEISSDVFENMISLYCKLIKKPASGWDKCVLAQVLHQLLTAAYRQYDVNPQPLFELFIHIFVSAKYDKATRYHEFLLRALLVMCQNLGSSNRIQLCSLGEAIIVPFIHLWKTKPTDSSKELMLEFFLLQMALHHPQGAIDEESGAFACDWNAWRNLQTNMYHLIIREINYTCERNRYSSSKDYMLHPLFMSVAVEVCAQVFQRPVVNFEVTQLALTSELSSVLKKRRLEVGFNSFIAAMQSFSSSSEIITWLQVICAILTKYQRIVPVDEIATAINSLIEIHLSCNLIEVKTWLLSCCQAAVQAFCVAKQFSTGEVNMNCEWSRLWELSVKCVSLMHQCHESGHKLLTTLLREKLVSPKSDFLNLYNPGSNNKVTSASLITLSVYLENFMEPSHLSVKHLNSSNPANKDSFRIQLLNWLLQKSEEEEKDFTSFISQVGCQSWKVPTVQLMSAIICSLCLQDYRSVIRKMVSEVEFSNVDESSWIEKLAQEVLLHTFDLPVAVECKVPNDSLSSHSQTGNLSHPMWEQVTKCLLEICRKFETVSTFADVVSCMKFAYLAFDVLRTPYTCGALTKAELLASPLVNEVRKLISRVHRILAREELNLEDQNNLRVVLPFLSAVLKCFASSEREVEQNVISELCFCILPQDFFTLLTSVASSNNQERKGGMNTSSVQQSSLSYIGPSTSRVTQVSAFNVSFSGSVQRKNRYDVVRVDEENDLDIGASEADNSNGSSDALIDPTKDQKRTEFLKFQSECLNVVTLMCKFGFVKSSDDVVQKLMNIVPLKNIDFSKRSDSIKLFLQILKSVLFLENLSVGHIGWVISSLRVLLNKCSKFRELCVSIITLFSDLYPHLYNTRNRLGDESSECANKHHLLHLLHVLWCKENENKCNKDVAYALAKSISDLLKHDSNVRWTIQDESMEVDDSPDDSSIPIISSYSSMLQSRHLDVRLFLSDNVQCFQDSVSGPVNQLRWFEEMYPKYLCLIQNLESQECENEDFRKDLIYNCVNSFLHFLFHVFFKFPGCRNKNLFIMCQLIRDGKASTSQVQKLLKQISAKMGYRTQNELMESYVVYLLDEWIELKYSIDSFPLALLEYESLQRFFKSLYLKLVPLFVYRCDLESLQLVANTMKIEVKEVVYNCLPQLLSRIFSWYSVTIHYSAAGQCLQFVETIMSKEAVSIFLTERMDDILKCLLNMLEDSSSNSVVENTPIRCSQGISPSVFLQTVETLKSKLQRKKSLINFLCQKQDALQNILLFVHVQLSNSLSFPEEGHAVLMCGMFVELLLPELKAGLPNYHTFVITELINSLINYVIERQNVLDSVRSLAMCIDLIQQLCAAAMTLYSEDIGNLLAFIISSLIPFSSHEMLGTKVLSLLTYLVIKCDLLENYIIHLDPFPDTTCLRELRQKHKELMYKRGPYTLEMEMDHLIQSFGTSGKATLEGLKHLNVQLKSKKDELSCILNTLQNQTLFLEDIKCSRLHRLMWILIHLCTTSGYTNEVHIEASRCLGEIGPVDFSTVLLQTAQKDTQNKELNTADACYNVLKLLHDAFRGQKTNLKVIASQCLKDVFKTKIVQKFIFEYQNPEHWMTYLYPFHSPVKINKRLNFDDSYIVTTEQINRADLWAPTQMDHSKWITDLVCTILDSGATRNNMFHKLKPMCKEDPIFCSKLLPYLIHAITLQQDSGIKDVVSEHISSFFKKFSDKLDEKLASESLSPRSSSPASPCLYLSKESVQIMLSVVNYLRLQVMPGNPSSTCSNCWTGLNLDYLLVAQAAQYCSAYFTAILFTELWCSSVSERSSAQDMEACSLDSSPMTVLNTEDQNRVSLVYKILSDAYSGIGDIDGIYGCIEIASDSQSVVQNHYLVERKWDKLLNFYDSENHVPGTLKALSNCGLGHTLQNYLHSQSLSMPETSPEMMEYQAECAWRLGQWDISIAERENSGFHTHCYQSLQYLYAGNDTGFKRHVDMSRFVVFQELNHSSLESVRSVLPMLSCLQMLVLMEDYSELSVQNIDVFQRKWDDQKKLPYADFEFFDPVSWLHCVLLKQKLNCEPDQVQITKMLLSCLEQHAACARKENHLEAATRALHLLRSSSLGDVEDQLRWEIEEAKILWTKKEHPIANRMLKSSLYALEKRVRNDSSNVELLLTYARALSLMGKFLEETCSENSTTIMENYLEKSIAVLQDANDLDQKEFKLWDAHLAVARFADNQYQSIVKYKSSTSYQTKQKLMADAVIAIRKMKAKKIRTEDETRAMIIRERQHKIDVGELEDLEKVQQDYLMKAVNNYLVCLQGTDAHDLWVFRLTALWFQNLKNETVNGVIKKSLSSIESYKFLPLMYQLAARMGNTSSPQFANCLLQLIRKISVDHPHHALPVIFSMSNTDPSERNESSESKTTKKDSFGSMSSKGFATDAGKQGDAANSSAKKERTTTAKRLLDELQRTSLGPLLNDMSLLCSAYISLAYMSAKDVITEKRKTVGDIPSSEPIMNIRNLHRVPVITEVTKVDRSCKYENIIGIHSFDPSFRLCGGINVPKVIKCVGIDGVKREQLVKGRDDLRQDAVMQQVFSLVNCLLKENNETKKRKLHIRTYKVVPLSQRSGVIQWCEGTQPLSQYLVGPNPPGGAHKTYYPQFWSHIQCQRLMKTIAGYSSVSEKRKTFDEICRNFPPVFRFFFFENFPEPSAWFERRQSYTKSVATSSIVGYILGLGDRHVNNILVDKNTAEIVHIDFGIAFEKGRILQTPETVPFRLTRDVVDGMGFIGVDGVFKRCCEKTMEVMRNSQSVLLTILEVLLYDPLYDWKVSATKSSFSSPHVEARASSEASTGLEVNKLAERALMRLQQKLQGLEEGMTLSVSGQVNLLIQQARDPNNLCRLYAGWQPYL